LYFCNLQVFRPSKGIDAATAVNPALNCVIGRQVPVFFDNLASTAGHIQGGKLRALAVTSAKRSSILPDVPTLAEAGVSGAEVYEWNSVVAPAAS
jgi:tripartite-type tricarboxylate transporter receptor subunit TctC